MILRISRQDRTGHPLVDLSEPTAQIIDLDILNLQRPHDDRPNISSHPAEPSRLSAQSQSCLTAKSRSKAPPATPSCPRKSPRRLAASSCSTSGATRTSRSGTFPSRTHSPSFVLAARLRQQLEAEKSCAQSLANATAAITSRSAPPSTSHTRPAVMPSSDSGRPSAPSLSASPTRS